MKKMILGMSAIAALATGATALYAAPPQRDGAGKDVTWAEVQAKANERWAKLDVNGDGKLDQADRDARLMQRFDAMDTNHDGAISRDEFVASHRAMADRFRERGAGGPQGGPEAGPRADGPGGPGHGGPGHGWPGHGWPGHGWHRGGGMGHHGGVGMMMRMADANKDGVITKAEYDAAVKAHFDRVDTNHDGKITKEERKAARPAMPHRMRNGAPGGGPMGDGPPPPPPPGA